MANYVHTRLTNGRDDRKVVVGVVTHLNAKDTLLKDCHLYNVM